MRIIILPFILTAFSICAQPLPFSTGQIDSMKHELTKKISDSMRVMTLYDIASGLTLVNTEQSLQYGKEGAALAKKVNFPVGEIKCLEGVSFVYALTGAWEKGIKTIFYCLDLSKKYAPKESVRLGNIMSLLYLKLGDDVGSLEWAKKSYHDPLFKDTDAVNQWAALHQISAQYLRLNKLDSALLYAKKTLDYCKKSYPTGFGHAYLISGLIASKQGKVDEAVSFIRKSIEVYKKINWEYAVYEGLDELANVYYGQNQLDSTQKYAQIALAGALKMKNYIVIKSSAKILESVYEKKNPLKAYQMLKISSAANDTITSLVKIKQVNLLELKEKQRIESLHLAQLESRNKLRLNTILGILMSVCIIALILYRNNRQKQMSNQVLEKTLSNLKSTQAQLIQSEKLASLGELTAGIAHEIQNPLNFVNNFAEVSAEMLGEMEEELDKGDTQEAKAIAADLKQNLSKINHHGKRASSIVKGMLEHSRASTGVKEPTNLNALADEFLRLAYHGLRAKDSSFNATMEMHFDPDLPLVSVIPQDIGRVLLNLINNAFYAVNEKAKQGIEDYSPTVTVSTKKLENAIEISVKDNGNGIPEVIKDKIFQPFFTTKPTGQGTGLGLSLAYDIVTKGHGGNLDVNSLIGEGTEFIIRLVFEPG